MSLWKEVIWKQARRRWRWCLVFYFSFPLPMSLWPLFFYSIVSSYHHHHINAWYGWMNTWIPYSTGRTGRHAGWPARDFRTSSCTDYVLFECCWWNACGSWQCCVYISGRRFQRNKTRFLTTANLDLNYLHYILDTVHSLLLSITRTMKQSRGFHTHGKYAVVRLPMNELSPVMWSCYPTGDSLDSRVCSI